MCKSIRKIRDHMVQQMDKVLNIVTLNIPLSFLSVKDLVKVGSSCKSAHDAVKEHLSYMCINYEAWLLTKNGECLKDASPAQNQSKRCCELCCARRTLKINPFINQVRCASCYGDLITLTQARKDYKLKDEELCKLNHIKRYSFNYRRYVTLYWNSDVVELAMLKHRKTSYNSLLMHLTQFIPSKAFLKRKEQLHTLLKKLNLNSKSSEVGMQCVQEFLSGGAHGIRKLKVMFTAYPSLSAFFKDLPTDLVLPRTLEGYVLEASVTSPILALEELKGHAASAIHEKLAQEHEERQCHLRLIELEQALAACNLQFRSDSDLCKGYVSGSTDKSLDEIVRVMENMEFLHQHTEYKALMNHALNDAYKKAKCLFQLIVRSRQCKHTRASTKATLMR